MNWLNFFEEEFSKDYYKLLLEKLEKEREIYTIYPSEDDLFNAFKLCPLENLKVIIFGQDPYHGEGEAMGLAFSVRSGIKIPPSLKNIYKELNIELGFNIPKSGDLTAWAEQGMLLINRTMTVRKDSPRSHKDIGWSQFTINLIEFLNRQNKKYCYVLLGNDAKTLKNYISTKDEIIFGVHPSPLSASRGFFNSNIFVKINQFCLENYGAEFNFALDNRLF